MSTRISLLPIASKAELTRDIWIPFNTESNVSKRAKLGDILESASNGIVALRVDISNLKILTGFSAPVELIPAQGVGKVIEVVNASLYTYYGGAAFATNTSVELITQGATNSQFNSLNALAATQSGGRIFRHTTANNPADTQLLDNAGLFFKVSTGDPTAGGTTYMSLFILARLNEL